MPICIYFTFCIDILYWTFVKEIVILQDMPDYLLERNVAIQQLALLLEEREQVEVKIARQRQKVAALDLLASQEDDSIPDSAEEYLDTLLDRNGLTSAVCTVMRGNLGWMTISQIQTELQKFGVDLSKYKAPAASITTTVNRLVEKSEVDPRPAESFSGSAQYRWIGSHFAGKAKFWNPPPLISPPDLPPTFGEQLTESLTTIGADHVEAVGEAMGALTKPARRPRTKDERLASHLVAINRARKEGKKD